MMMPDTLSLILLGAALLGGLLRAYINGTLNQKQTLGDIVITGAAGGSFPMLGVVPKDLSYFHAGLMMFGVAYVASDALQSAYKSLLSRFSLLPPTKTVVLLPLLLLAGCASATPGTPPVDPFAALTAFTVTDLQAALAQAQADGDVAGVNCWTTLLPLVQTTTGALPQIKGVASAIQAKRHLLGAGQAGLRSLATQVNVGCAALLNSETATLVKFGVAAGGGLVGIPPLPR